MQRISRFSLCSVLVPIFLVILAGTGSFAAPAGSGSEVADEGGGSWPPAADGPELTPAQRREIERKTAESIARLRSEGKLPPPIETTVLFHWPLVQWNGNTMDSWGISNFVDQDPTSPSVLDYLCGPRTYDGHHGTDIFTWPWPWKLMDEDQMAIVAAAPGTIVYKDDGNFDMSCATNGGQWNAVLVQHSDGSIAWYGHMKKDSVTPKPVGQTVVTGEYLGIVGSSGNSTGPHLHFEIWENDSYTQLLDPYQGACNSLNPDSMWVSQRPYQDPKIIRLTTGPLPPSMGICPAIEDPREQKDFASGTAIRFTTYYRDQILGSVTTHEVFNPDDTLNTIWTSENTSGNYNGSWWWQTKTITGVDGTYTWHATHDGKTTEYLFNIGIAPAGATPATASEGAPLLVAKSGTGGVTLSWGASCRSSDSDYNIYQGTLDSLPTYNHKKSVCGTGGARQWTLGTVAAGDLYWLVAPRNGSREGSLGTNSVGDERPQPANALQRCQTRNFECS